MYARKFILIICLFLTQLNFTKDFPASYFDSVDKNSNKVAAVSGALILVSAFINSDKIVPKIKPFLNEQYLAKASLYAGGLLACSLLYCKYWRGESHGPKK